MTKYALILITALWHVSSVYCQNATEYFPVLKGTYLGQKTHTDTPEIFPPAALQPDENWFWHSYPSFSNDLREMYFIRYFKRQNYKEMYLMKMEDGIWKPPERFSFTKAEYQDNNPFLKGNDTLLFYSTRFGGSICMTIKAGAEWSQPVRIQINLPSGLFLGGQFSFTRDGDIYAELSDGDIYCWKPENGKYSKFEKLDNGINSVDYEFMPFADPYERFLLFCRQSKDGYGKTDIYISFQKNDGSWSTAKNMGPEINSVEEEAFPSISPDGKYFFFCREGKSGFNPFWVPAKFIEVKRLKE